jgi:hypothetical protein
VATLETLAFVARLAIGRTACRHEAHATADGVQRFGRE